MPDGEQPGLCAYIGANPCGFTSYVLLCAFISFIAYWAGADIENKTAWAKSLDTGAIAGIAAAPGVLMLMFAFVFRCAISL